MIMFKKSERAVKWLQTDSQFIRLKTEESDYISSPQLQQIKQLSIPIVKETKTTHDSNVCVCVCVQGRRCVLKDCCKILDNTVLPPETVVPPFTVFSGCPGPHYSQTPQHQNLFIPFLIISLSLFLRSVLRGAPRVHTRLDDRCNQELLPEVSAPQPDLSSDSTNLHSQLQVLVSQLTYAYFESSPFALIGHEFLWLGKNIWSQFEI